MYYRVFRSNRYNADGSSQWGIADRYNRVMHYEPTKLRAHAVCEQMEQHRADGLRKRR